MLIIVLIGIFLSHWWPEPPAKARYLDAETPHRQWRQLKPKWLTG